VHFAFTLYILTHTRLFMCTSVYVNQIRLFCHIIGGLKLFPNILRRSTVEDRFFPSFKDFLILRVNFCLKRAEAMFTHHDTAGCMFGKCCQHMLG